MSTLPAGLPAELAEALAAAPQAHALFLALPASHQREYGHWISEAKRPQTRQQRAGKALAMLLAKSQASKPRKT
ncbi:YdeI/OmpD-associated family protein [Vandammella animalimorsus]|uniref:Bacteriocin-protection protein n=1 Tax=Vandammella animalimorsus TaxID=2029117 RepID=A0A2A2A6I5_9BURK|nr:YdeI/OmpD-associated family protein [Vandammella animalimorsus]PAT34140.1 bacteriocin-protection protein [Vandammella animalimorsus]